MSGDIMRRGRRSRIFRDATMAFLAEWLLGLASQGGTSVGLLLHCFGLIRDGDPTSWTTVFILAHEREAERAATAERAGREREAAAAWLSASVAAKASLMLADPAAPSFVGAIEGMRSAFAQFLRLAAQDVVPLQVPFRDGCLRGYASEGIEAADLAVLILGGGDTFAEDLWFLGGRALHEAGIAFAAVGLPGQGDAPLQGWYFGADTLEGLTATLDTLHARGFAGELVLLGWSGGGIFVTKYASLARPEDRLRAVIGSTPIHDVGAFFAAALPSMLQRPDSPLARAAMAVARRRPVRRVLLAKYDWQFGPAGIAGVLAAAATLGRTELASLDLPVLALVGRSEDAEALQQANAVVDSVRPRHPVSDVVIFDAWTGADAHCQVGNLDLALERIIGWLTA